MPKACQCAPAPQPQNRVAYRCDLDKGWLLILIFIFFREKLVLCLGVCCSLCAMATVGVNTS